MASIGTKIHYVKNEVLMKVENVVNFYPKGYVKETHS